MLAVSLGVDLLLLVKQLLREGRKVRVVLHVRVVLLIYLILRVFLAPVRIYFVAGLGFHERVHEPLVPTLLPCTSVNPRGV